MKTSKDTIKVLKETKEFLIAFKELLYNFSKEDVVKFAKDYESIKKLIKRNEPISLYLYELIQTIIKLTGFLLVISL